MGLNFEGGVGWNVNHGSASNLDDLASQTFMAWVYVPNSHVDDGKVFQKGLFATGFRFLAVNTDETISMEGRAAAGYTSLISSTTFSLAAWQFLVGVLVVGDENSSHLYIGDLNTAASETAYGTRTTIAGAAVSNAAADQYVGNYQTLNRSFEGYIAVGGIWDTALTLAQIRQQQWSLWPVASPGNCVLFCNYGLEGGTAGTQPDWSGNRNNGAVTGVTATNHVPLSFPLRPSWHEVPPAGATLQIAITPTDSTYWVQGIKIVG